MSQNHLTNGKQMVYNNVRQQRIDNRCKRIMAWLEKHYNDVLAPERGHLRILWEGDQIKVFIGRGDKIA